jgi:hypothetical protein
MSNSNDSTNTTDKTTLTTAVGLSLASGILILMNSLLSWLFIGNMNVNFPMGGMMGNMGNMMGSQGFMWWGGGLGGGGIFPLTLVAGIMILFGVILMYSRPKEKNIGGIIVIIFSVIGFTGMGFSILGSILGIIGGVAALIDKSN